MLLTHEFTSEPGRPHVPDPHPSSSVMLRGEGRVSMTRRGPNAVVSRLVGTIEQTHVAWLLTELEHQVSAGATVLFLDASRATAGEASAIENLGRGLVEPSRALTSIHVLADSTMARVAHWGPPVRVSPDPVSFHAALDEADREAGEGND